MNTKRLVEMWNEGYGVVIDGNWEPAPLRAVPAVAEMLELTWRVYMAYREQA